MVVVFVFELELVELFDAMLDNWLLVLDPFIKFVVDIDLINTLLDEFHH
jgi:hypothetical protein